MEKQNCKLIAFKSGDKVKLVVAFDVLNKKYLCKDITEPYSLYNVIDLDTIKPYDIDALTLELEYEKKHLEDSICLYQTIQNNLIKEIKRTFGPNCDGYRYEMTSHKRVFRRILESERQKEIIKKKIIEFPEKTIFYEKELRKLDKGIYRAYKRLNHFYKNDDFYTMYNFIHRKDFSDSINVNKSKIIQLEKNIKALKEAKAKLLAI